MKAATDSQRLLELLNEQDRAFRELAIGASATANAQFRQAIGPSIAEIVGSPSRSLSEQLRDTPVQRAIDIARQLSEVLARGNPARPTSLPTGRLSAQRLGEPVHTVAELGALVRRARKMMKMNQTDFAAHAGVGRRFVSELEGGKPSLEFDKVMACANAAGIDFLARLRSR